MSDIKIRVGAAIDASVLKAFDSIDKAADRSRKALVGAATSSEKSWAKLEREIERDANKILKSEERAAREAQKAIKGTVAEESRAQKERTREVARETRERTRIERQAQRDLERERRRAANVARNEERQQERNSRKFWGGGGGQIGIGRRAALGVSRGTAMLYGYGGAAMSAGARMLGVDTDVSGMVRRNQDNASLAQQIINAAPSTTGQSVEGRQAAAGSLLKQSEKIGVDTATGTSDVLDSLRSFVAKTGDLETARDVIGDMARLSRATGTSLEDMGGAAAEVTNHLGDVPNKAQATMAVMRAIAGQGKLGAVEIRDMAVQMAKLASQAPKFEGGIEGNIAVLGAMAQESKLRGGSASASQAATAVMSFAQDLATSTTNKHWKAAGLSAFTDNTHTKLRSPEELILSALKQTGGDQLKLAQLFPSKMGRRAVTGFASIYNEAGGGQKGLEAVDAEFRRLSSAAMTQNEVTRAFNAQMETGQSKVQIFNNQMQQVVEELTIGLLPAFTALSPIIVDMAQTFSGIVTDLLGFKKPNQERGAIASQNSAINTLSNLHEWERQNLSVDPATGGTGPDLAADEKRDANAKQALKDAAPLLADLKKQADAADESSGPLAATVAAERAGFVGPGDAMSGGAPTPLTDDEIKQLAGGGDSAASQYINDKATLDRLHDTIGDLHTGIRALTDALTSGKILVKMPKPPTKAHSSGTEPAESPEPEN